MAAVIFCKKMFVPPDGHDLDRVGQAATFATVELTTDMRFSFV
jgi:hypothetical protein